MIIVGVTGPIGAGKSIVVDYLCKKGFAHFSAREFIASEVVRRKLPINRDALIQVGNELRAAHSASYVAEQLYDQAKKASKNCVLESIRVPGEVFSLRKKGNFYLIAVTANQRLRYDRIVKRNTATDHVSFETFKAQEEKENENSDPMKQNISACLKLADVILENDGTITELEAKLDDFLEKAI